MTDDRIQELWHAHLKEWPEIRKTLINPVLFARAIEAECQKPDFCDHNCTWLDHHPECEKAEPVDLNPATFLRLLETVKYLVGIAERGEGRKMADNETAEQFVLGYVKRLEKAELVAQEPASDAVVVDRGRIWIKVGSQSFMLAHEPEDEPEMSADQQADWYANQLRKALSKVTHGVKTEPVQFLLDGARFKLSFDQVQCEHCGEETGEMTCRPLDRYASELQGAWVALVPAENRLHLHMSATTDRYALNTLDLIAANEHAAAVEQIVKDQQERLQVLEREHAEFYERWHDERRKREALQSAMRQCLEMLLTEPDTKAALFRAEEMLRAAITDCQ